MQLYKSIPRFRDDTAQVANVPDQGRRIQFGDEAVDRAVVDGLWRDTAQACPSNETRKAMAHPLVGGRTPILSIKEFEQLGFNAICFGLETILHAAKAMETVLADMRAGTFALRDKGMSFEEFKQVVHYDRWDRIDNTYGVP